MHKCNDKDKEFEKEFQKATRKIFWEHAVIGLFFIFCLTAAAMTAVGLFRALVRFFG